MMKVLRERVALELLRTGTGSVSRLTRASTLYGIQVWSEIPWTMPPVELPAVDWCQEVYLCALAHLEAMA
jgi:hypothetical protein